VDALILRDVTTALGGTDLGSAGGPDAAAPRRLIAAAIDSYLQLVERDPEVYRFVVGAPLLDRPTGGDPAGPVTSHIAEQMSAVLAPALEAAGRDTTAAAVWGPGLVGMVRAAADQWLAAADPMPRERLAEHLTDLAWGGLSSAWPTATPSSEESP
jgi:hypothetical protein